MATITRHNLHRAVSELSPEFVSTEARARLACWAYDAKEFNLAAWDGCPLDQAGFVKKFERRSRYEADENTRFVNEASEVDARIIAYVETPLTGEVSNLKVVVRS